MALSIIKEDWYQTDTTRHPMQEGAISPHRAHKEALTVIEKERKKESSNDIHAL